MNMHKVTVGHDRHEVRARLEDVDGVPAVEPADGDDRQAGTGSGDRAQAVGHYREALHGDWLQQDPEPQKARLHILIEEWEQASQPPSE